jgi:hypothetical protein
MKTYTGTRTPEGCTVTVRENGHARPLPLHLSLRRHSPSGFEWGYGGSGPAQLALAMCFDTLRDRTAALDVYQAFKRDVIAAISTDQWTVTEADIRAAVAPRLAEREQGGTGPGM